MKSNVYWILTDNRELDQRICPLHIVDNWQKITGVVQKSETVAILAKWCGRLHLSMALNSYMTTINKPVYLTVGVLYCIVPAALEDNRPLWVCTRVAPVAPPVSPTGPFTSCLSRTPDTPRGPEHTCIRRQFDNPVYALRHNVTVAEKDRNSRSISRIKIRRRQAYSCTCLSTTSFFKNKRDPISGDYPTPVRIPPLRSPTPGKTKKCGVWTKNVG